MLVAAQRSPFGGAVVRACVLSSLAACTPLGREVPYGSVQPLPEVQGHVVTNLDLFAAGEVAVDRYLARMPASQRDQAKAVIQRGRQATARVRIIEPIGTAHQVKTGTGVFVRGDDGSAVVLSAGHTFAGDVPERILLVTARDGTKVRGAVLAREFEGLGLLDFAVLRCEASPQLQPSLAGRATPRVGELVVAFGYSDDCGLGPDGHAVFLGANVDPRVDPLVSLHTIVSLEPFVLAPVAGAMPSHGASGGGLFDLDGNVVGVVTGFAYEMADTSVYLRLNACPITAMHSIP